MKVLYYSAPECSYETLARSILLFDEIHFFDRPSINLRYTESDTQVGTVGRDSSLRRYDFGKEGMEVHIHKPFSGPLENTVFVDLIKRDMANDKFVTSFMEGFLGDEQFRYLFLPKGKYGGGLDDKEIYERLKCIDFSKYPISLDFFLSGEPEVGDSWSEQRLVKLLLFDLVEASFLHNHALLSCVNNDVFPVTDFAVSADLLRAKCFDAYEGLEKKDAPRNLAKSELLLRLSIALIPDELLRKKRLSKLNEFSHKYIEDRKAIYALLDEQIESCGGLQDPREYDRAISSLYETKIEPLIRDFNNKTTDLWEQTFKESIKDVVSSAPQISNLLISLVAGLSLEDTLIRALGIGGVMVGKNVMEHVVSKRRIVRNSTLSYLLGAR